MRDMSCNLPTWAYQLGYRLKGEMGTYGCLYLSKEDRTSMQFGPGPSPSILEIGDIISGLEGKETRYSGNITYTRF